MKAGSGDQGSPPCFLRFPRPVRVVSGAEVELKCVVLGEPPPTVLWEKGGQQLVASERLSFPEDGAEHSLLLSGALPTDAGVYVCRARNTAGEAYAAAAVTVLELPAPEPEPQSSEQSLPPPGTGESAPVFLTGPQSQWVLRGAEVVLTCQVGGLPEPKLYWEKDGMALDEVWDSSHFALEPSPSEDGRGASLTLRIKAVRLPDSGVYVCHARNAHGHAQAGALLQVHQPHESPPQDPDDPPVPVVEPLKCAPKTFWVNEGKHAKFRCYVMGKPEPEIEWHWEGRPLLPDRRHLMYRDRDGGFVLKVLYCQAKDRGLYVCAARNSAGQTLSVVQLHVKEPRLRFTRPLQDVEGREHGIVVLECKVPNSRIPTAWFREDQRLLPCRKYEQIEEGTVRRLIIHRLKADDDGVYLCEMRGRVRTVANVTVKGPILKRLPRKLDVLEGENAVLLVETREAGVQGSWSHDGEELPATCQSSSGHMHALVLPGVTREDAGEITFSLGNSRTTTLLRVKCVKHSPPGPPVLVEMFKGQKNTVLLTWKPPEPPPETSFIYRLERQEVGSEDWVQCFSIEKAGAVEVPGDCVPAEGDYRFRICTVSEHGRSPHVVFNGSAHLVPTARLVSGLEDVQVYEGEDAVFSLDLSTIIQGTWFLNGEQLKSNEPEGQVEPGALRYRIEQKGLQHRLILQAVRHQDSGALVGFSCPGVQDSAALAIQDSPVHILSPQDKVSLTFTTSERVVLTCELSRVDFPATWYKDGQKVEESESLIVKVDGRKHRLILPEAQVPDSGEFECRTEGVSAFFSITVQDPPVHIVDPQEHVFVHAITSECVMLTCEVDREDTPVQWYKDGQEVQESDSLVLENEGPHHRLLLPAAQPSHGGEFQCVAGNERAYFTVTITDVSSWIVYPSGKVYVTAIRLERVVLTCELCRPWAEVRWTKDGEEAVESPALLLEKEDTIRRLVLPSVQLEDSGEYLCEIDDESASFTVTVTEPPVRIIYPQDEVTLVAVSLECVVLTCELSREDAPVHWYKDGLEVEESEALVLESDGPRRRLVLPAAQPEDGGEFVCDAGDDSAFFTVTVTAPPERIVHPAARSLDLQFAAPGHVELRCEVAPAGSQVCWYKDGLEVEVSDSLQLGAEGPARTLTLPHAQPEDAGEYVCETRDEAVTFNVSLAELPVQFLAPEAAPSPLCVAPGEPVVLSCELSRASAQVFWNHNGSPVQQSEGLELRAEGPCRILCIQAADLSHAGVYTCQAGAAPEAPSLTFNVQVAEPPPVKLVSELTPLTVHEGDDATFQCEVSPPDAQVTWLRNGAVVTPGPQLQMVQNGSSHTLIIRGCQLKDTGTVTARVGATDTSARLHVRETELLFLRRLQDVRAEEGQDVCLEVETGRVGAAGAVRWLRGGEPLPLDSRLTTVQDGHVHRLSIHGVLLSDQGTYGCESHHDRTLARLSVRPRQLRELRPLEDVTVIEGGSATFQVELSQEGVTGEWAQGGVRLHPGPKCHIYSEGHTHSLVLSGLGLADSGCISFTADTLRCAARLSVREVPVTIVRGPQDLEVTEGDTATFECELSQTLADVVWEKDGQALSPSPRLRLQALGARRLLLLRRCNSSDAGTYSCVVGTARSGPARLTVREREVSVLRELRSVSAREGDSATFECTVSETETTGRWELGGRVLRPGGRVRIRQEGKKHILVLSELRAEDTGEVCFQAGPAQSLARLEVEALPLQMCRRPPREKTVLAGRRAVLEVTVSRPGGHVCWLREGVELCPGSKYEMRSHGPTHSLVIHDVRPEDQGTYSCQAGQDSADTQLLVEADGRDPTSEAGPSPDTSDSSRLGGRDGTRSAAGGAADQRGGFRLSRPALLGGEGAGPPAGLGPSGSAPSPVPPPRSLPGLRGGRGARCRDAMRASLLLSVLRPAGPVAVGISLGFTLSLLSVTWVEEPCGPGPPQPGDPELPPRGNTNAARRPNSVQPGAERERPGAGAGAGESWEPRVLPYHPAQPGQAAKKAVRTRYISTELGIRQKLLVAVLTSQATLPTLGVAVNRTLGHRLERVVFLTGARGRRTPSGMAVVTLGEERPIGHLHLALRHLLEQHGDDFDWFFLVPDATYTEAHGLERLAGHLSLASATHLYLGRPQDFIGGETTPGRYCHGGFGVLLSRTLLQQLRPHLESCRNDIVSARPDEWLGRCILDATGVGCTGDHEGVHYNSLELSPGEPLQEGDPRFRNAVTAHPVYDPVHMYQLHKAFARAELDRTYQEIRELQLEIQNTSRLAADGERASTWPVGIPAPSRPASRFEVLRWDYFTEQYTFSCADGSPRCPLRGADQADVADVLGTALEELNRRYQPALRLQKQQLVNGYRRFDPARGMEYTLDLQLEALTPQGGRWPLTRRVQLLRPLSRVEILPVPYVTEASRLTVLLPIAAAERDLASSFLEAFATAALEPGDAASLTLLLLYEPRQAQRAAHADVFAPVKAHVAELERRFPGARVPWLSVQTAAPSPLRLMDLLSKKHPLDTLFLLAGPDTVLTPDFLNRCRMHAISGWQAFFPMHFQAFHPAVAPPQGPGPPELGRDTGHFDRQAASEACFYNSDYVTARGRLVAASEQEEELLESLDVYELFLRFSSLHVLRAVEPALLQRYRAQPCSARLSEDLYHRCRQSMLEGLGSRTQLAMLLFEQEQGNST